MLIRTRSFHEGCRLSGIVNPEQHHHQVWVSCVTQNVKEVKAGFSLSLGISVKDPPPRCVVFDFVFAEQIVHSLLPMSSAHLRRVCGPGLQASHCVPVVHSPNILPHA